MKLSESFCERPWGTWLVLAMQPGYKVKKLTVNPGQSMSKQYHTHRDEYWVVFKGRGDLFLDYANYGPETQENGFKLSHDGKGLTRLYKGSHIKIEKQVIHKVTNTGDEPLVIIETQVGEITEEGDIVRLD
jgi:mannose-6-phosphate isomerase-like protein (cupin superfamily)